MNIFRKSAAVSLAAILTAISSSAILPAGSFSAAAASVTVSNPVIWSDVPDNDVIRVGDTYYMVSTTMFFSPGAPIMKSKDLVSWEICNYVYDTLADGDVQNLSNGKHDYAHGQWAASLRYHDGSFYVFFGSYGTGKSYIFKTDDIENGSWSRTELNGMYHDASMLFDDDGRNYLVYGGGGEIKIKEFNSDMSGFKPGGAEQTLLKTGLDGLSGEGSHIQKIGDYYYIFLIAWPSGSRRIELCYRSKSLLGNYEGKTVLNSGLGTYGGGVAQGGIVDTPDGKWYGLLFQDHGSVGRIPVLVPVEWQQDWPIMGVNGAAPLTIDVDTDLTGTALAKDDDFSSDKLALEWQWNHNPDNSAWSLSEREGWLRLTNKTLASNLLNAKNTLTMRTEGPSCSSVVKLDASGMKPGDKAGLSAFQFKYGEVGVYVADDGSKKIFMAENGGYSSSAAVADSFDKIVEEAPLSGNNIYLKTEFVFNNVKSDGSSSNNIDKAKFFYSYNGSDWTQIGSELSMVYDLKLFTGYRSGIFSYGTKSAGGFADFDMFDYERAEWNAATVVEPDQNGWFFHDTFEGSVNGWTGRGAADILTSGRTAYEGNEALLVENRSASWNGTAKSISANTFKPGNSYSFSVNTMYFDGAESADFKFTLQYKGADGEIYYDKIASGTAVKGEWIQLANQNYTIPDDASDLQIYVETSDDSSENFYIDEAIGAVGGTVIEGAGEGLSVILGDICSDQRIDVYDMIAARKGLIEGFDNNKRAAAAADVDRSGAFEVNDMVLLNEYVLGKIKEFPTAEKPQPNITMADYTAQVQAVVSEFEPAEERTAKAGVKYGTVTKKQYYSNTCKRQRNVNVLLPANYDPNKKYPVLYALHGYWQNEDTLISETDETMKLRQIIGNAIASGEAEDMIVVFPYIYASAEQEACSAMDDYNNAAYDNFINELTNDLMPWIESNYPVKTGRENTAITGFSMGGRESLYIGFSRPDLFAYVGAVCPAPGLTPGLINASDFKFTDTEPYLVFLTAGSNDTVVYSTPSGYNDIMNDNNVPHIWHYVTGGYHGGNSIRAHMYNFIRALFKAE